MDREQMRISPFAPRVRLNRDSVWELPDERDMSQNELARQASLSPGHLSLLMNWKRSPSPYAKRRLQRTLGVDDFHRLFIIVPPEAGDARPE
jgi:transcriptional regulator with XRE-family HTH domain